VVNYYYFLKIDKQLKTMHEFILSVMSDMYFYQTFFYH